MPYNTNKTKDVHEVTLHKQYAAKKPRNSNIQSRSARAATDSTHLVPCPEDSSTRSKEKGMKALLSRVRVRVSTAFSAQYWQEDTLAHQLLQLQSRFEWDSSTMSMPACTPECRGKSPHAGRPTLQALTACKPSLHASPHCRQAHPASPCHKPSLHASPPCRQACVAHRPLLL